MYGFRIRGRDFIIPILLLAAVGYALGKGVEWVASKVSVRVEMKGARDD